MFLIDRTSIFTNASYIARKGLFKGLLANGKWLQGKTLDFGCGTKPYRNLFPNVTEYIGVEYDNGFNSISKVGSDFFYDGKTLPFADASFDSFFSSQVFEHVFNLEEILPEINRVLKPGAHFMVSVPFVWPEHEQPFDYGRYSSFGMPHLLEKNGFKVATFIKTSNYLQTLCQLWALYLNFFMPKKPLLLYRICFALFITPVFIFSNIISFLPKRLKRMDLFLDGIVIAEKV